MGKQIKYYMGFREFLSVAGAALDGKCTISKRRFENGKSGIISGSDIGIVSPECANYLFTFPELNELNVIEAGFSIPDINEHIIYPSRLYLMTGKYDSSDNWLKCSESITKIYDKLVRIVKKTAPYTEVEHFVVNPMYKNVST